MDLPFEALIKDNPISNSSEIENEFRDLPFLVKDFQITYLSDIHTRTNARSISFHRKTMLLLTCTNDRLAPEIGNETELVSREIPRTTIVDLTNEHLDLKLALINADVIHFAGHIRVNWSDSFGTILGCSDQLNGAFRLSTLLNIRLNSDLVFINGCESAEGRINQGDGKLSTGLFFLLAGAKGVIEHRWQAPDLSGSFLACSFYHSYPCDQPAKALVDAKRKYLTTCQPGLDHPHFWAGIVYTSPLVLNQNNHFPLIMLTALGACLLLIIRKTIRKRR